MERGAAAPLRGSLIDAAETAAGTVPATDGDPAHDAGPDPGRDPGRGPDRDDPDAVEAAGGLRLRIRSLCSACRQVFGVPDYDRYVAHARQRHPDAPLLARGDFFNQAIDRKYGKGGMRCC